MHDTDMQKLDSSDGFWIVLTELTQGDITNVNDSSAIWSKYYVYIKKMLIKYN